jgi:hypothetical protein
MSTNRRGHLARVALCPKGCKATAGKLFDIGNGGCEECHRFKSLSVVQQGATSARLIEAENRKLQAAAVSALPNPKSPNREATQVVLAAQIMHASSAHEQVQASRALFKAPPKLVTHKKAVVVQCDLGDDALSETAVVGVEVDVRPSPGMGNGLFSTIALLKGKRVADYMGHRLFKDGSTAMFCKKTESLLAKLPAQERDILLPCNKVDKWSLNVGSKPSALTNIQSYHSFPICRRISAPSPRSNFRKASWSSVSRNCCCW